MAMIDSAIDDVAGRFGLGPKAGQLMQELVHLITGSPGGVGGFTPSALSTSRAGSALGAASSQPLSAISYRN